MKTILINVAAAVVLSFSSEGAPANVTIRAQIDGLSKLVIRPDSIRWDHVSFVRPGRWGGDGVIIVPGYPTTINGAHWLPQWPDDNNGGAGLSAPLDALVRFETNRITLTSVVGRSGVQILQQPMPSNQFTLVGQFDDVGFIGAEFSEIQLSGISVTLVPSLSIEVESVSLSWLTQTNQEYQGTVSDITFTDKLD